MTEPAEERNGPYTWCVVANVARETSHGPDGRVESGLKHFAPGARVWVLLPKNRFEDAQVEVVGVHRGRGGRHVPMIVARRHLENFRIKAVHSPAVLRAIDRTRWNWRRTWCCPELMQPWVDRWNALNTERSSCSSLPWPARETLGRNAGPCPHQGPGSR